MDVIGIYMNNLRRYISHIGVFNTIVIYDDDDYKGWVTCFYPCIRYSDGYYTVYNKAGEMVAYCENELEARMIYYRLLFRGGDFYT